MKKNIKHKLFEKRSSLTISFIDMSIMCLAYFLCLFFYLHLKEKAINVGNIGKTIHYLLYLILPYVFMLNFMGLFRNLWQFMGVGDIFMLLISLGIASVVFIATTFVETLNADLFVFTLLTSLASTMLIILSRLLVLTLYQRSKRKSHIRNASRVAIVGAGQIGSWVVESISSDPESTFLPVCFFDDNNSKIGRTIKGVKIIGTVDDIESMCQKLEIKDIIVAMPSATAAQKRRVFNNCAKAGCRVITVPSIDEYMNIDKTNIWKNLRKINVEDLLGREPIVLDSDKIASDIKGKVVMVTGGGGSIGSELCRQVAQASPSKLVIVDIYENNAYDIQQELLSKPHDYELIVEIASVRDNKKLDIIFNKYRPDIVYHAAAHKHVPLMENNPDEAVKNNIFGTYNAITLADKYKVGKFVLISSDKAVNPTNVMGATKRFCEMMIQAMKHRSKTRFLAVRFGNVLGSNGSVIPLFKKQIEAGGPVHVTHKDIIRYFMTIPEAVSLVMLTGAESNCGSVYVLDMGLAVKIDDLARKMISLAGFVPDRDIKIIYTGLRPGEKMFEELVLNNDRTRKTTNDKIYVENLPDISWVKILNDIESFNRVLATSNFSAVAKLLMDIIIEDRVTDKAAEGTLQGSAVGEVILEKLDSAESKQGAVG